MISTYEKVGNFFPEISGNRYLRGTHYQTNASDQGNDYPPLSAKEKIRK